MSQYYQLIFILLLIYITAPIALMVLLLKVHMSKSTRIIFLMFAPFSVPISVVSAVIWAFIVSIKESLSDE